MTTTPEETFLSLCVGGENLDLSRNKRNFHKDILSPREVPGCVRYFFQFDF